MAATKEKHAGGRPPIYKSVKDLDQKIEAYFDSLEYTEEDEEGNESTKSRYPTITGLALALGFNSKQSLYNYEEKPEFLDSIKKARLRVENGYEESLRSRNPTGAIFALKNFGWVDKQEVEHSGDMVSIVWNSSKKEK